ncbi:MAG: hypothetical protein ACP6IS_03215 [Candidatus Asgardarchaeia archaeon]
MNYKVQKTVENVINVLERVKKHQNSLLLKLKILLTIVTFLLFINYEISLFGYLKITNPRILLSYLVYPFALISALILILTILPFVVFPSIIIDSLERIFLGVISYDQALDEYSAWLSSRFLLSLILAEVLSSILFFLFFIRSTFVFAVGYSLFDYFLTLIPLLFVLICFLIVYRYRKRIFVLIANSYLNIYSWDSGKIDIRDEHTYPQDK